jgi:hypothetical protein
MKTKLLGFAILVIALVGCQQHVWKEFSSREGQFSLLMPGIPVEGMDMINTSAGAVSGYTFSVEQEEFKYVVGYADYPENVCQENYSDHILNSVRQGMKGTLLNERTLSLDKHPGRQLIAESSDGYITQIRVFLVENRLYQLAMITKMEQVSSREIQKFFDSFQLL